MADSNGENLLDIKLFVWKDGKYTPNQESPEIQLTYIPRKGEYLVEPPLGKNIYQIEEVIHTDTHAILLLTGVGNIDMLMDVMNQ